jgi:aerobic-type carbon monoxide dehydrogenase small subunit (CoxS/CutS family)
MKETIRFTLNGKPVTLETDPERRLLWVLRTDLELTGTKYGCGEGDCGACTVLVDGEAVRSCRRRLDTVRGRAVVTIEGLARNGELHPLQRAFHEHGGLQCGYCTPGMITRAYRLLQENPSPSEQDIRKGIAGNLCRCTGYQNIVKAVQSAAKKLAAAR